MTAGERPTVNGVYIAPSNWVKKVTVRNASQVILYADSNPPWVASLLLCLGLLGLVASRDPWVSRCALTVGGYVLAFLIVGRPDNAYWGDLIGPLLPLGWVLAPMALADLARAAFQVRVRAAVPQPPQS